MLNPSFNDNAQDLVFADYRVYIEGVQIPFESAQISNVYGQLPTASLTLPPWPGLQELGRNYMPKVNIFWLDNNYAVTAGEADTMSAKELLDTSRDAYKLLFSGIITGTVDSKNVSADSGNQMITLNCSHSITVMNDILIRYGNQAIQAAQSQLSPNSDSSVTLAEWDINTIMIKALMGVDKDKDEKDVHYVEKEKFNELQGTPGILRVMWNILKRDASSPRVMGKSTVLTDIYIPLIEDGLKFWERLTGHPAIEQGVHDVNSRIDYNDGSANSAIRGVDPELTGKVMVPSVFRSFLGAAAQKELAITAMQSLQAGQGPPESSSFMDHMEAILRRLEYDMVTLSSPVSVGESGERMYEYIVKPILPSYYSPICNVILPNLLNSVTVSNNYDNIPSRTINLSNLADTVAGGSSGVSPSQAYASPHSVRYARAGGSEGDLNASLSSLNNLPGRYEYGSGVRAKTTQLPSIYNLMKVSLEKKEADEGMDESINGASAYGDAVSAWEKMYPSRRWLGVEKYNPLTLASNISSFNRLNFMYSDQQFAMETAKARTGQASGVFNPYPIVGYPMDLVDAVPSRESYHGLCTNVSHFIHASGQASTSYGVSAVNTFSELALYNVPAVNPYLSSVFQFKNDSRIYANEAAYTKACQIYLEVLGVGAGEPALLQDYSSGMPIPFTRSHLSGCWATDDNGEFLETVQGSLNLVARNITSLYELDKERVTDGLSPFIDISDWINTEASNVDTIHNAANVKIKEDGTKIESLGRDTESSPFLHYTGDIDEG